jgi:2-keto-4-pentenoate hydratase
LSAAEAEPVADLLLIGLRLQFEALAGRQAAGDELIGWKVGLNATPVQQHFGITRPVLGHLTTASLIEPGSTHSLAEGVRVGVEPEVAIHLGVGGKIASLGPAIEVVDLDPAITELDSILAGNVFHRGLVLGPALEGFDPAGLDTLRATVTKNGSVAESALFADAGEEPGDVVTLIGERLALVGEELAEGQVIIAGSLTPIVFVEPGDGIEVQLGPLGSLALTLA